MRMLVLLTIGIAIGALCGSMATRSIAMTHAYPRGVMAVLQVRLGNARRALDATPACDPDLARSELAALAGFIPELSPALEAHKEPRLLELSRQMQAAATATTESAEPANCAELAERVAQIAHACDACHQEYR
jgi:hypothetical protein